MPARPPEQLLSAQIAALLVERLGVAAGPACEVVRQIRPNGPAARDLRDYLREHPAPLTSADSLVPQSVIHLAHALRAHGYTEVVLPHCVQCDQPAARLPYVVSNGRVCETCRSRRARLPCTGCGALVHRTCDSARDSGLCRSCRAPRRPEHVCSGCRTTQGRLYSQPQGHRLCAACRAGAAPGTPKPPYRVEPCAGCGRTSRVFHRRGDGSALCQRCYRPPSRGCVTCGRRRPVHQRTDLGPVCRQCYEQPQRICGSCGQEAPWRQRPRGDRPGICHDCYTRPTGVCARCGSTRQIGPRTGICTTCAARHAPCDGCRRLRPVVASWPIGQYCGTCYQRIRADVRDCPGCCGVHPLIGLDEQGQRVCAACAGLDYDYACRSNSRKRLK